MLPIALLGVHHLRACQSVSLESKMAPALADAKKHQKPKVSDKVPAPKAAPKGKAKAKGKSKAKAKAKAS